MYKRILVAIDGSATAKLALDEAIRLAKHCKASVQLVHVVDKLVFAPTVETARAMADMQKMLRTSGRKILEDAQSAASGQGVSVDAVIREIVGGRVAEAVTAQASRWRADLIVIGTHGRRGFNRLMMGSDAEQVVRTAPVPVLVIRARSAARTRRVQLRQSK
jgi:nucleotide-binding universal stress UspA family protein